MMPVAGFTTASCPATPVGMVGKCRPHPAVTVPLQAAALITETVPGASPKALLTT
jgi:hypothetical protein